MSQLHHGIGWTIVISMYFPIPIVNRIGRTILVSSSNSNYFATMSASNGQDSEDSAFWHFLAVQNSSIGDLVTNSLTDSLSDF